MKLLTNLLLDFAIKKDNINIIKKIRHYPSIKIDYNELYSKTLGTVGYKNEMLYYLFTLEELKDERTYILIDMIENDNRLVFEKIINNHTFNYDRDLAFRYTCKRNCLNTAIMIFDSEKSIEEKSLYLNYVWNSSSNMDFDNKIAFTKYALQNKELLPSYLNNSTLSFIIQTVVKEKDIITKENIIKSFIKHSKFIPYYYYPAADYKDSSYFMYRAAEYGYLSIIDIFLEDSRFNPSDYRNNILVISAQKGYFAIIKKIINDKRIDFTLNDNEAIKTAHYNKHLDICRLLFNNTQVKQKLKINDNELYTELSNIFLSNNVANF